MAASPLLILPEIRQQLPRDQGPRYTAAKGAPVILLNRLGRSRRLTARAIFRPHEFHLTLTEC